MKICRVMLVLFITSAVSANSVLMLTRSVAAVSVSVSRLMENLDRGVVAVDSGGGQVYVGWRMLGVEPETVGYNVYRDGVKINPSVITDSTNYIDISGSVGSTYSVASVIGGVELDMSSGVSVWSNQYLEVPLQVPAGVTTPDGVTCSYSPNDASVGDLDGDGQYEIILKWDPSNSQDNSISGYTGNVYLDAYEMDGTFLWRIDLGVNIRAGAHYTQFIVYDLDSDGYAEVACRTSDGTVDGVGTVIGDSDADYRESNGYILTGPEYLTLFNGQTGQAMVSTDFYPNRVNVSQWGDNYGNRCDRFLAGVAYVDGQQPSLIMARGYYGPKSGYSARNEITAWNWRDGALTQLWWFKAGLGINDNINSEYIGQGNHQLSIGDVDGDGKDEIIYGACAIDDDGTGLYSTGYGHGDALHLSDLDPSRPGLEVFTIHEGPDDTPDSIPRATFRDAGTGDITHVYSGTKDVGRGVSADIDASYPGAECWGFGGLRSCSGEIISSSSPSSANFVVLWDGDLLSELLNSNVITKHGGSTLLTASGCSSNNTTKSTPCLSADILGDWREEVIWRRSDNQALRIYTTTHVTSHRIYTLMHDPQYRLSIAWQNTAYNQPPHTSFFLGDGMADPPVPDIILVGAVYGDFNVDSYVNMQDLTYFLGFWLEDDCGLTGELDLNQDCLINYHEFSVFAGNWTGPDITPPSAPSGLSATAYSNTVLLDWADLYELDLAGYNVYRSTVSGSDYTLLNTSILNDSDYVDNDVVNGSTYYYVVTALDVSLNESEAPTEVSASPNAITTMRIQEDDAGYVGVYAGTIDFNHAGYTGPGFVNTTNATDQYIEWSVDVPQSGAYDFQWRFANEDSDNRTGALVINNTLRETSIDFSSTGSWEVWDVSAIVTATLSEGVNTIRLVSETADGLANIDWVEIKGLFHYIEPNEPEPLTILEAMRLANDYFMAKWPDPGEDIVTDKVRPSNIWTRATYYEGLMALYAIDPNSRYYNYAVDWGESHNWGMRSGNTTRNADDQCCGQTYIDLYLIDPQPERIANIKESIDGMVASAGVDDWWWIDALHMAMPVFARLGAVYQDDAYYEKMYEMYLYTKESHGSNGLYNATDHLWWRDKDFDPPYVEPNGEDCYWSRGNGWVFAAMVRVLDVMEADAPHRAEYVQTFQGMAQALAQVQRSDGFWNVSLHDPDNYGGPELSGTAFFTYGMAWGINNGLLDAATYEPIVLKAWDGMVRDSLHPNGFLGYVQGTGKEPASSQPVGYNTVPNFEDFGLGAFLLAGGEVYELTQ